MVILRIGKDLFFSTKIVSQSLIKKANSQGFSCEEFDEALLQFIFHLETCEEAIEVFDDFDICPVCGATSSKGLMVHKNADEFIN
jgi:hypothetical protein